MSPETRCVVALFGPTGVGKTAIGIEVAKRLGTRIISCDSMQLYPDFPVLTNQPDAEELSSVSHVLVSEDIGTQGPQWTAASYGERAAALIEEDLVSSGCAVLVGGTGLYLRAALAPLDLAPQADARLIRRLQERALSGGGERLHEELACLDKEAAGRIHPRNVRRVVRALAALLSGRQAWSGRDDLWKPHYRHSTLLVGLALDRRTLYNKVTDRTQAMVEGGAVQEVQRYLAAKQSNSAADPACHVGVEQAIGYKEVVGYLQGECSREEMVERLAAATRRYARRQLTWMRKLEGAVIIDVTGRTAADVATEVLALARQECGACR